MRKDYYGVLSTKLENGTVETSNFKSKRKKGKKGLLHELGIVVEEYLKNYKSTEYSGLQMANLEENPMTYQGDFEEEINKNIQTIRESVLSVKYKIGEKKCAV